MPMRVRIGGFIILGKPISGQVMPDHFILVILNFTLLILGSPLGSHCSFWKMATGDAFPIDDVIYE
jgi:hypothetical protein